MQVLQHTTPQVKDVETLQISNDSLTSSNLPNSNRTNSSRKAGAPSSFHNVSHPQRDQAVVEVELESTQTLLQSRLL
ncbi:MAG: hypothetical protein AAFO83_11435, partial [Cyanobacteria bacterium J06607_13]